LYTFKALDLAPYTTVIAHLIYHVQSYIAYLHLGECR